MPDAVRHRLLTARSRIRSHPRWRWLALVVVASGMWLSVMNVSIVNIALPEIARDFGVDVPSVGWVFTGFLVTQATLLPIAGRLGDLYGRRRVFVAGVIVLSLASILCALAPNAPALVGFRILQGMGACAMAPTAFAYAAELFAPGERAPAMGFMGGVIGLAPVVALNVAGALMAVASWRSVFWFSPVMGVVVLAGAALVLHESTRPETPPRFDIKGALLAAAGLFSILLALSRGETWGWGSGWVLGSLLGGLAALALFFLHERRTDDPMLDLRLLRLRSLATANLAAGASAAALFGTLIMLPFFLSAELGYGPVELGLAITPVALSFVVVAPIAGRFMGRIGSVPMAVTGFAVAAAGGLWMAVAATAESYGALLPGITALGVGLAMTTSPITVTALSDVPQDRLGVASALPNISRYSGGALGAAVLSAILAATLPAGLTRDGSAVDAGARADLAGGFRVSILAATAFLLIALAIATRMPNLRLPRAGAAVRPAPAIVPRAQE